MNISNYFFNHINKFLDTVSSSMSPSNDQFGRISKIFSTLNIFKITTNPYCKFSNSIIYSKIPQKCSDDISNNVRLLKNSVKYRKTEDLKNLLLTNRKKTTLKNFFNDLTKNKRQEIEPILQELEDQIYSKLLFPEELKILNKELNTFDTEDFYEKEMWMLVIFYQLKYKDDVKAILAEKISYILSKRLKENFSNDKKIVKLLSKIPKNLLIKAIKRSYNIQNSSRLYETLIDIYPKDEEIISEIFKIFSKYLEMCFFITMDASVDKSVLEKIMKTYFNNPIVKKEIITLIEKYKLTDLEKKFYERQKNIYKKQL